MKRKEIFIAVFEMKLFVKVNSAEEALFIDLADLSS